MKEPQDLTPNPQRKPKKGPGRPAAGESLTPQEVAEAALQLILAEGEAALTMRHLGEVLGVKAMALYNHFPNKEAILDAVTSLSMSRLPSPPAKGPWKSRIKAICRGFRAFAQEQPNLFRVAMSRPTPPTTSLPLIESVLSALSEAGLAPAAQAVAYQTLRLYVRAYCLWEIEELRPIQARDWAELAGATKPYPRTAAVLEQLFAPEAERQFEAGLDLFLRGLKTDK
jgi:AcrR family transcriptional regulator